MDYLELDEQRDQIDRELIKCVVIGDSGVGKTRLICAEALGIRTSFPNINQNSHHVVHFPSVFAIDRYHESREIRERANFTVDGVNVALRLWDTFGDHEMNRKFAYQNADVAVICFSINMPSSFRNVNAVWYPDLKKYCPRTPIILAGTRSDLRCQINSNAAFKKIYGYSLSTRIRQCILVAPDMGRQVATEIGAAYYECSAVNMWGTKAVFENAVRAALVSRRSTRFWSSHLKKVSRPLIQEPFLPERPIAPSVIVAPSTHQKKLLSVLESTLGADVVFCVQGGQIKAHMAVLVTASPVFAQLFGVDALSNKEQGCFIPFLPKTQSSNEILLQDAVVLGRPGKLPRGFQSLEQITTKLDNNSKDCKVCVTLDNSISSKSFKTILDFLYTGRLEVEACSIELVDTLQYLQVLNGVSGCFENILQCDDNSDLYFDKDFFSAIDNQIISSARKLVNAKCLSDVVLVIEGQNIPAHKVFLFSQCEMLAAMFMEGHFKESGRQVVGKLYCCIQIFAVSILP